MRYALNVAEGGRILSATFGEYAPAGAVIVEELPEGNIADYLHTQGQYVYSPLPEPREMPTQLDMIEAQVTYTAMMTDTLLEV